MDKKIIFILILLAIIAIALIYYLKKNSDSWKIQANLNLAFANKLGIPIVDAHAEVIDKEEEESVSEEEAPATEQVHETESQETTTEPEVTSAVTTEPEIVTEPEVTNEPESKTESEIIAEQEMVSKPEVTDGPESSTLTVVHTEPTTDPVVEETTKSVQTSENKIAPISNKKGSGKNKGAKENSERKVNSRSKKKSEEEGLNLVNPVPLHIRVGENQDNADKKVVHEKINKLKNLQKNVITNKDLFDANHGSGE